MEDDSKLDEEEQEAQQQEQEALWAVYSYADEADRDEGRGRKVVSVTFLDLDAGDAGEQQNGQPGMPSLKRQSSVVGTAFERSVRGEGNRQ